MTNDSIHTPEMGPAHPGSAGSPAPRKGNPLAVATLVLGLVGFLVITIPVALVTGLLALARAKGPRSGRVPAALGILFALGWAGVLGVAVVAALDSPEPKRNAQGQITEPGQARPDTLRVGDCIAQIGEGQQVSDVKTIPCDSPNGGKVFAVFDLAGGSWPGAATVEAKAGDGCTSRFKKSKRQASQPSSITFLQPTELQWKLGNHKVICLVEAES